MFDFDEVVDRKGTNCAKWDTIEANNKPKDVLPMWVADMDFKTAPEIIESLKNRVEHGVFGADMKVELLNDGPFTIVLDSKEL